MDFTTILSDNTDMGLALTATKPTLTALGALNPSGLPRTRFLIVAEPVSMDTFTASTVRVVRVIFGPTVLTPILTMLPRNKPTTMTATTIKTRSATPVIRRIFFAFFINRVS